MTDPDLADQTYVEPLTVPYLEEIIRRERPDALLSTVGGQTGLNLSVELAEAGVLENVRRGADRRQDRRHQEGRRPPAVQRRHAQDRPGDAAIAARQQHQGRAGVRRAHRLPVHPAAQLHAGRHRRRHRLQPGGAGRDSGARPGAFAGARSAHRRERAGLEGIRAGGDARPGRQLHHRLLHRELRPHGRAHRRFHHGGARADPHRPRIPDDARWRPALPARNRRGYRRLQRAVRHQPAQRADGDHRDEPARLAQLRAGLQGHRLPHRQDRRQAGGGLPAGRDPQRHHAQDARLLRAHHRLRGGQDSQVGLREIPRRRPHAGHADEIGGRSDGHRPHLQGSACEGHAQPRNRQGLRLREIR